MKGDNVGNRKYVKRWIPADVDMELRKMKEKYRKSKRKSKKQYIWKYFWRDFIESIKRV